MILGFILFIIAYLLFLPLSIINFLLVRNAGYFKETAINLDKLANREFRTLWNATLRKPNGYNFGAENETISSALGKNQLKGTLTRTGKVLVWILDKAEKNHCIKSITQNAYYMKNKLAEPTPLFNVILWYMGSFFYALAIFFNENRAIISELGLKPETETRVRIFGIVLYFGFTYFNFNKSTLKKLTP